MDNKTVVQYVLQIQNKNNSCLIVLDTTLNSMAGDGFTVTFIFVIFFGK